MNELEHRFLSRSRLVTGLILIIGLGLIARLVQLQVHDRERYSQQIARQTESREPVPARPGDILDRNGQVLAKSITVKSLYAIPTAIDDRPRFCKKVAEALGITANDLEKKLTENASKSFLWLKRRLTEEEADRIRAAELEKGSWGFRDEYLRIYPQAELAAHVLGIRDIDRIGRGGVEQSCDRILRGTDGFRLLVKDARGRVIDVQPILENQPKHGEALTLTLDIVLQLHTELALGELMEKWKPKSATVIVLRIADGEVLAMGSRPTFNPNDPGKATPEAWKNRAIVDQYEPGSTIKPCIVAWGLESQVIGRNEQIDCENGVYQMGGRTLHEHDGHAYGVLDVTTVVAKSSNIGMAKIGEKLTNAKLHEALIQFGFGKKTGIELPGELAGGVRPLKEWTRYSTGSIPMGQEFSATPLQVITAYGALANQGGMISPRIVRGDSSSQISTRVLRPEVAEWMTQEVLTAVVERGTGKNAKLSKIRVFGKTGTAQKADPRTGLYSNKLHTSSFVCGGPAEAPRVLVLVSVDEPSVGDHYGGTIAASTAARLLEIALERIEKPNEPSLKAALEVP